MLVCKTITERERKSLRLVGGGGPCKVRGEIWRSLNTKVGLSDIECVPCMFGIFDQGLVEMQEDFPPSREMG